MYRKSLIQNFGAGEKCFLAAKSQPPLPLSKKARSAGKNSLAVKLPVLKDNKLGRAARVRRALIRPPTTYAFENPKSKEQLKNCATTSRIIYLLQKTLHFFHPVEFGVGKKYSAQASVECFERVKK